MLLDYTQTSRIAVPPIALIVIVIGFVCCTGQQASASIQGHGLRAGLDIAFDHKSLDEAFEQLSSPPNEQGSSMAGDDQQSMNHNSAPSGPKSPSKNGEGAPRFAFLPSSSSSTTTTSPTGSVSGGAIGAMLAPISLVLNDNSPIERYVTDCALFLPDAPANELLRPPQA